VHANEKTDITCLFPGAYVDFTWNNVFVVSIWTSEPVSLTKSIKQTLAENTNIIQTLVFLYTLKVSTQKWLSYDRVWVAMLVLIFDAGCACDGGLSCSVSTRGGRSRAGIIIILMAFEFMETLYINSVYLA
jgi:hypothetical protein